MNYFSSLPFNTKMVKKLPCVIHGCTSIPDIDITDMGDQSVASLIAAHAATHTAGLIDRPAKTEKLDTSRLPKVQLGAGEMTTHKWKVWKCGFEVWKEESGFGADKDMGYAALSAFEKALPHLSLHWKSEKWPEEETLDQLRKFMLGSASVCMLRPQFFFLEATTG